jgi:glycosyltransferase involved in cell wall biosynthesis
MKIIALNINQSNVSRGLESFLSGLKKEMETRDVQFDIVSDEHFFPPRRKNSFFNRVARRLYLDSYSLAVLFFTLKNIVKIIKSKPDILIPANGGWQVLIIRFLRLIGRFKVVIIGEAGIGYDDEFNLKYGNPNVFVALTKEQEDWAKKINPKLKIVKIPNGVDSTLFCKDGEKIPLDLQKPIFLCVAAFDSYKNIDKTIYAVSELNKGSLVVLGEGVEKTNLEKLGKEKLGSRFLTKKVNYDDLPKWYRSANVFTLVSGKQEAFGNVYIEAMACGLPIVATDDEKRHEIVGQAGIFVRSDSLEEYKTVLMKAAIINWGDKPRVQAEKFSWEKIGEKYLEALSSTVSS